jgi:hypothetical protein
VGLVTPSLRKRSEAKLVSCNETQISETQCAEIGKLNYPAKGREQSPKRSGISDTFIVQAQRIGIGKTNNPDTVGNKKGEGY